jgi:hypothetical protein
MTFFLLSMVLVAGTFAIVRPAMVAPRSIPLVGATGSHIIILATGLMAIALTFDLMTSAAVFLALGIHELGLVLGHRLAGHEETRFRFLPMPRSGPVSHRPQESDLSHFFVTLMGPALGLAPMVAAFALSDLFPGHRLQHLFGTVALSIGAFNFVALLPIWPLPGGTLVQLLVRPGLPRVSALSAAVFFVGLASLGWASGAPIVFITAVIGALAYVIRPPIPSTRPPMSLAELRLAIPAYLATLSAYFLGGWWVLLLVTGRF